jgi:hypothetical protein
VIMGIRRSLTTSAVEITAQRIAPSAAGGLAKGFMTTALVGAPGFAPAIPVAERIRADKDSTDDAISALIRHHARLAAAQGFLTQLGGTLALPVTLPANIAGLGVVQLRMSAGIAHLRHHDLGAPRVRLAVLATLLGQEEVYRAIEKGDLPGRPGDVAFGPPIVDPDVAEELRRSVGRHLATRLTGKRAALTITRAVPLLGGGIGAAADAVSTWQVGHYAAEEFIPAISVTTGS